MELLRKAYAALERGEVEEALALAYTGLERKAVERKVEPELLVKVRELHVRYLASGIVEGEELKQLLVNVAVEPKEDEKVVSITISGKDLLLLAAAVGAVAALLVPAPPWIEAVRIPAVATALLAVVLTKAPL